ALRGILPKKSYKVGLLIVAPAIFIAIFFVLSGGPCLAITCRHLYSCSWILIFTGHTLVHEPQSVEAKGRELCLFKSNPGERMERSEEHTSELQSRENLVCRLLLE